jgi:cytochrome c-type protein NapB
MEPAQSEASRRVTHVAIALAVGAACALFLLETAPGRRARVSPVPSAASRALPAPAYAELRELRRGPNADMYAGAFAAFELSAEPVGTQELSPQARAEALSARRARRAYDGAPPVIPHAIGQREPADCLACHEQGARVAGKIAHPFSHEVYASCTQCHVVARAPAPLEVTEPDNGFVGLASFGVGQRAFKGSPPTIPHPTNMRSQCASCHGPNGLFGMRTPHPERQSCQQCHAPSAELNQTAVSDLGPIGFDARRQP